MKRLLIVLAFLTCNRSGSLAAELPPEIHGGDLSLRVSSGGQIVAAALARIACSGPSRRKRS